MRPPNYFLIILFYILSSCNDTGSEKSNPMQKFQEGFVEADHVKLQYLDWGGNGPPLILICGLGDTPFLFDDLAKDLSLKFHVIGYSRRDHGKSIGLDGKFDNATLVADLKLFLDSLRIDRASLLGWSMGGNEISGFASLYPERVDKLIYFESGYDYSDGGLSKMVRQLPYPPFPGNDELQSLDAYRDWYHNYWFKDVPWKPAMEANLLASTQASKDGRIKILPNDSISGLILREVLNYRRDYSSIKSPALVIYAEPFLLPPDELPYTLSLYDSIENHIVVPWRLENRARIEQKVGHFKQNTRCFV